ncbi:MAG: SBBP repeat-containing protein [candidate division WOR-3 bacterium]
MKVNNLKFLLLFLLLTFLSLIPNLLFSQVDTAWVRRYDGENDLDWATAIFVDNNGNVYVTGCSCDTLTDLDYTTLKYDSNGNLLWERRYNGPGNGEDVPYVLFVDNQGNVYVTGRSDGSGTYYDYATLKYDANGNLLWERRYNGPENSWDCATSLFVDNYGNVYVTGFSFSSGTYEDYVTLKYDVNGNLLWERRYNGPGNGYDEANALFVDNYGNVYVTGFSYGSGTWYDYATLKYDANGNLLWERRYDTPRNGDDGATSLFVDNFGNVYVTGYSLGSGTYYDYATLKYDGNGNLLWERRYNGLGNDKDYAASLFVDNFGNVYVTGYSLGSGTSFDYATLKYDADGNLLWERRYNGVENDSDYATSLFVDNDGNVYVTGFSKGSGTYYDYATLKYDANGNLLWEIRYNGSGNWYDSPTALFVDNDGNVYVTGGSYGSNTYFDYATIKYIQRPSISEEKENKIEKKLAKKGDKIYDISGKLVKEKKLKKGIYFKETEKEMKKILILK